MTWEECEGCECLGEQFLLDKRLPMKVCKHPKVMGGIGIWIPRIKKCPKENGEHDG